MLPHNLKFIQWQNNRHKIRVPAIMQEDLLWWNKFLPVFNEVRVNNHDDYFYPAAVDTYTVGGGLSFGNDRAYVNWAKDYPSLRDSHINVKEAAASQSVGYKKVDSPLAKQ